MERREICKSIGITGPTLGWYMKRMERDGILSREGGKYIPSRRSVKLLARYKPSFSDKMVENFVSMWER